MTPIERACRALCKARKMDPDRMMLGKPTWQRNIPYVKAILETLREPTMEMTLAAKSVHLVCYGSFCDGAFEPIDRDDAAQVWTSMMSVVLD